RDGRRGGRVVFSPLIPSPDFFVSFPGASLARPPTAPLRRRRGRRRSTSAPSSLPSHDGAAHRCPCLKGRGAADADADAGCRRHLGSHTRKRDTDGGDAQGRRIEYWFSGKRYGDEVTRHS
ncbi:unnamed protein product, partial [Urochloa humidicola]